MNFYLVVIKIMPYRLLNIAIYLSCFTSEIDRLTMWSLCGNEVKGCCLVLSPDYFGYTVSDGAAAPIMDMANNTNYNCFPSVTF